MDTLEKPYLRLAGMIAGNLGALPSNVVTHYLGNAQEIPGALLRGFVLPAASPEAKFADHIDLGIVTVPAGYDHATCLQKFLERNREKFCGVNDNITDANFANPSRRLKAGDKFRLKIIPIKATVTSDDCLVKLRSEKAVLTGAQGLTFVFDQKRDQLPKGKYYPSFDKKDRLWKDADGYHRVPVLVVHSGGVFDLRLDDFECDWDGDYCLLCLCDLEKESSEA